ncbi:hypothetical protein [Kitasatospora sp. NPDC017646]|uniref:hypothetical protein n=1 Tax=Kitasatospora sp. NPDC017646 TaxID=3364024 RepID=UPI0037A048C5
MDSPVVITGPAPSALDELGGQRAEFAFPAGASVTAVTVAGPDGTDPAPQPAPYTVTAEPSASR